MRPMPLGALKTKMNHDKTYIAKRSGKAGVEQSLGSRPIDLAFSA